MVVANITRSFINRPDLQDRNHFGTEVRVLTPNGQKKFGRAILTEYGDQRTFREPRSRLSFVGTIYGERPPMRPIAMLATLRQVADHAGLHVEIPCPSFWSLLIS